MNNMNNNRIDLLQHKLVYCIEPNVVIKEMYSVKGWNSKDEYKESRCGCLTFKTSEDSIKMNFSKLVNLIKNGHEFRSVTGKKSRSQRSFLYTHIVPIDFDDAKISLKELLAIIEKDYPDLIPSVAYETFSNTEQNYRYRLLYVFSQGLKVRKYKAYYKYIVDSLNKVVPNVHADSAFCSPVHSFLGTNKDAYIYCSNKVFVDYFNIESYDYCILLPLNIEPKGNSLQDIENYALMNKIFDLSKDDIMDHIDYTKALQFNSDLYIKERYINSPELKSLMDETCGRNAISPVEFINKYKDKYETIEHTLIEFGDKTMLARPEDYYDLDWLRLYKSGQRTKRKDGQRRKTTLGIVALYLRLIKPSITPDEMYYNLVRERLNYYNNEDSSINNHFLRSVIKATFMLEPDEIQVREANIDVNKPTYIIDVTRRKSIGSVEGHKPTRKLTFDPSLIDWTKTCKDNYKEIVKEYPLLKESTFKSYFSKHKH